MLPTQCPNCGRWLKFNMSYSCGNPVMYYTCECGYDSSKQNLTYGTTTKSAEGSKGLWKNLKTN